MQCVLCEYRRRGFFDECYDDGNGDDYDNYCDDDKDGDDGNSSNYSQARLYGTHTLPCPLELELEVELPVVHKSIIGGI